MACWVDQPNGNSEREVPGALNAFGVFWISLQTFYSVLYKELNNDVEEK